MKPLECIHCGKQFSYEKNLYAGQVIFCPACDTKMYVYSTNPLRLTRNSADVFESPGISVRGSRFRRNGF
jgi:DNA-directed RNA polymerase subunit RPC12/RpoP